MCLTIGIRSLRSACTSSKAPGIACTCSTSALRPCSHSDTISCGERRPSSCRSVHVYSVCGRERMRGIEAPCRMPCMTMEAHSSPLRPRIFLFVSLQACQSAPAVRLSVQGTKRMSCRTALRIAAKPAWRVSPCPTYTTYTACMRWWKAFLCIQVVFRRGRIPRPRCGRWLACGCSAPYMRRVSKENTVIVCNWMTARQSCVYNASYAPLYHLDNLIFLCRCSYTHTLICFQLDVDTEL
jgi:hypothetical protein